MPAYPVGVARTTRTPASRTRPARLPAPWSGASLTSLLSPAPASPPPRLPPTVRAPNVAVTSLSPIPSRSRYHLASPRPRPSLPTGTAPRQASPMCTVGTPQNPSIRAPNPPTRHNRKFRAPAPHATVHHPPPTTPTKHPTLLREWITPTPCRAEATLYRGKTKNPNGPIPPRRNGQQHTGAEARSRGGFMPVQARRVEE